MNPLERLRDAEFALPRADGIDRHDINVRPSDAGAGIMGPTATTYPKDFEGSEGLHGGSSGAGELVVGLFDRGQHRGGGRHGPVP
ncbi:hypothetical protein GCM10009681_32780 [Luedemannella helvata]|uniref:Uncharacterized protein n=1 Tax=Luedemannella helvata TaxID=349315 RepID=A0ABN2KKW1_9ACTN